MSDAILLTLPTARQPGAEPLPGYRLLEPLGRGGFGEVWKCVAPGGLLKAVKFVPAGGDGFRQEATAFEQIKAIRHPFLLTLERVETVGAELVMVMELADGQLHARLAECKAAGLPGIPPDELVGYLKEVAEALDTMGAKYGLQHLDVKPENLFVVAGHAKVGDYGLVRRTALADGGADEAAADGGFTPKYTAPEVLLGGVDIRSDQYSLALVYVELLTGVYPYPGRSVQQLMLQHMRGAPNLGGVPEAERPAVSRALSKDPADRFPSCQAFVKAVAAARPTDPAPPRKSPGGSDLFPPDLPPYAAGYAITPPPLHGDFYPSGRPVETGRRRPTVGVRRAATQREVRASESPDPFADLHPVMEVSRLHRPRPRADGQSGYAAREYAAAVVRAAAGSVEAAAVELQPEGVLTGRFLSTIPASMVPYKLVIVAERWGLSARQPDPHHVVLRRVMRVEVPKGATPPPPAGFEVVVRLPAPPSAEIGVSADLFGSPDGEFARAARADMPVILTQIRGQLQNLEERRQHPRYPTDLAVRVYPLFPDGDLGTGIDGRCRDVSLGGVRFVTPTPLQAERLFVEFPEVDEASGLAVYVRVLRSWQDAGGHGTCTVGRFRLSQG